jgi:hypothetical protein
MWLKLATARSGVMHLDATSNVGDQRERFTARSVDLVGKTFQQRFAPRDQRDLRAHLCEGECEVAAMPLEAPVIITVRSRK